MILAAGEALPDEVMRSARGVVWTAPGDLRGPFRSGAPPIFASFAPWSRVKRNMSDFTTPTNFSVTTPAFPVSFDTLTVRQDGSVLFR